MVFPRKDGHRSPSLTSVFSCTLFLYWSESEICSFVADSLQTTNYTIERVTGRKARGLQTEEIGCKCQTFLSLLSSKRKQTSDIFSTRGIPPCSRWGCRQSLHESFSFLVLLSLSLRHQSFSFLVWLSLSPTDTGTILVPPASTTEVGWRCIRCIPDGIPDQCPVPHP